MSFSLAELGNILVNIIAPVISIAALGFLLSRVFSLDSRSFSRVSLYLFTPALIFAVIYRSRLGSDFFAILAFAFLACALMGILAWILVKAFHFQQPLASAFALSTLFVNSGNFGVPLSLFAFGEEGLNGAVVYYVATTILSLTVAVFIAARGVTADRAALLQVFKLPVLYAAGLALIFNAVQFQIPEPLMKTIDLIGGGTVPLFLLILGIELSRVQLSQDRFALALSTIVKLAIAPLLAFGLAVAMGLQGVTRSVCILEASMPTAVLVSILAVEFDAKPEFVTSTVFISTLASVVTLTILIGILR